MTDSSSAKLTLPGVFAALGRNSVEAFSNLRPHQRHPWHAFLCQLGAIALTDGGAAMPPAVKSTPYSQLPGIYNEAEWKAFLLALAPDPDAWSLVVEDAKKPAFLQPPIPDGCEETIATEPKRTPDDLDVLVTSKNTDEKTRRITSFEIDHWIFALVSAQGQAGYSIAPPGNYYSTARQNGNYATRPGVGLITSTLWGDQWGRDCRLLIDLLDVESEIEWDLSDGKRLLWLEAWDGKTSLPLNTLHPYFLEVCLMLRMKRGENGSIEVHTKGSKTSRVEAKEYKGAVDDPWIPVNKESKSAFNSAPSWENMARILLDHKTFQRAPAQIPQAYDHSPVSARFCILVRGQGKTEEYHEKTIPIPSSKIGHLRLRNDTNERTLTTMITLSGNAKSKVLYPAVSSLLSGTYEKRDEKKKGKASPLSAVSCRLLDDAISDKFFSFLWRALPDEGEEENHARQFNPWIDFLRKTAGSIFDDLLQRRLQSGEAEFICAADAELLFRGAMKKHLPLFEDSSGGVSI